MKVVMTATTYSDGRTYNRGSIQEVEDIRAAGWLDRGLAKRWVPDSDTLVEFRFRPWDHNKPGPDPDLEMLIKDAGLGQEPPFRPAKWTPVPSKGKRAPDKLQ